MRIAFIGKGGSGKTSLSAAMLRHCYNSGLNSLGFDVDINAHLASSLGAIPDKHSLIERTTEVFDFLEPNAQHFLDILGERPKIGALPVSEHTKFISCNSADPFIQEFSTEANGVRVLTAGKYDEKDVGNACHHAKLFSSQLVAHRIIDEVNDVIVFDATAGTDPVATSLLLAYDFCVVVVEPTAKSVSVFKDFITAADVEHKTVVVANKIRTPSDFDFICSEIPKEKIVAQLGYSRDLRLAEQGDLDGLDRFSQSNKDVFNQILNKARKMERPKKLYFEALHSWFSAYAQRWYDPLYDNKISKIRVPVPEQFV